jgi:hypothetical protein
MGADGGLTLRGKAWVAQRRRLDELAAGVREQAVAAPGHDRTDRAGLAARTAGAAARPKRGRMGSTQSARRP